MRLMKKRFLLIAALAAILVSCGTIQTVKPTAVEKCDIENVGTRIFLEEVDYAADTAYTVSFALQYMQEYGANDKPLPVRIAWTGDAARLIISTATSFKGAAEQPVSGSPAEIFNLIPGVNYFYKVLDRNGKAIKTGCVRPVGPLRWINGIAENVRDLGGWQADGGHIAYGKIYRGARLSSRMPQSGKDIFLKDLGIALDLDLRGIKESEAHVGPVIDGADYLKFPVEKNLGRGTGNTQELYQQAIRAILGYLSEGKPVYFHCAGGADRTGSLAFLIEALVGVSESDLSKDYELTTFAKTNKRLRNFRATEKETHILYELITYLRKFGDPKTMSINELTYNWATTRHADNVDPLSPKEIELLRKYLIVKD